MTARLPLDREIAAVRALAARLGLGAVAPRLVKAAHHTTLHLAPLPIVARVQSACDPATAWSRATREVAVVRALAEAGAAVLDPPAVVGPHRADGVIATLWPLVDDANPADEDIDGPCAAAALAALHRALRPLALDLPRYTDALDRCAAALDGNTVLSTDDRSLLSHHLVRLRGLIGASGVAEQPIHGDVHLGNLLVAPAGPVWIDWEEACLGPVELDISGFPSELWPRFAGADPMLVVHCADLRSVTVAIWCAADPTRSDAVREAAASHLGRVRTMGRDGSSRDNGQ